MSSEQSEQNRIKNDKDNKDNKDGENTNDDIDKLQIQNFTYPDPDDPDLQLKLYGKREFYYHSSQPRPTIDDYNDMKEYRDNTCGRPFAP